METVELKETYKEACDAYVSTHRGGTCYHMNAWRKVLERAYEHPSHYFIVRSPTNGLAAREYIISGILPLFHLKNFLFGNQLVSLPFCDYGGILADNDRVAEALLQRAFELAGELENAVIELRQVERVVSERLNTSSHKVQMVLEIDGDADKLWKGFDAKLRSQIRKPEKEGLTSKIGGLELLDDFYQVFSSNMRDLGSPVHPKKLPRYVLEEFGDSAKLQVVYKEKTPVGAGLVICFKDTVYIPWASTVRRFNRLSPNMMLYWNFLKFAADNGFRKFDFGRSALNEGTYKFKEQWGAKATPLYWQYGAPNDSRPADDRLGKAKYGALVSVWKKLPLPVANFIGPHIRKHISL